MRVGGTVRNTLKDGGKEKGEEKQILKEGQAGLRVRSLKKGLETPYEVWGALVARCSKMNMTGS